MGYSDVAQEVIVYISINELKICIFSCWSKQYWDCHAVHCSVTAGKYFPGKNLNWEHGYESSVDSRSFDNGHMKECTIFLIEVLLILSLFHELLLLLEVDQEAKNYCL
jgi:hypothetical protein